MKRYILLRDNRIIDTGKYFIVRGNRSGGKINLVKNIIKEADELIDLIEKGDWLEFKGFCDRSYRIEFDEKREDGNYYSPDWTYFTKKTFENELLKIWKPNEMTKGYDLAWERKE